MLDRIDSPRSVDEAVQRTKEELSKLDEERYKEIAFKPLLEFFLRRVEQHDRRNDEED